MTDKEQNTDSVRNLAAAYWEQDTDEDARLFAEQPVEWLSRFAWLVRAAHALTVAERDARIERHIRCALAVLGSGYTRSARTELDAALTVLESK